MHGGGSTRGADASCTLARFSTSPCRSIGAHIPLDAYTAIEPQCPCCCEIKVNSLQAPKPSASPNPPRRALPAAEQPASSPALEDSHRSIDSSLQRVATTQICAGPSPPAARARNFLSSLHAPRAANTAHFPTRHNGPPPCLLPFPSSSIPTAPQAAFVRRKGRCMGAAPFAPAHAGAGGAAPPGDDAAAVPPPGRLAIRLVNHPPSHTHIRQLKSSSIGARTGHASWWWWPGKAAAGAGVRHSAPGSRRGAAIPLLPAPPAALVLPLHAPCPYSLLPPAQASW